MKKYEKELKDAIRSGDTDRISIAKSRLHQRKMRLSSTPQNLWDGGSVLPNDDNSASSILSPEEKKAKNATTANKVAGVVSVGANMVSSLIDPDREDGTVNVGQNMAKSAIQMGGSGAAAGAVVGGPVGAVVGGVIGAGVGLITGNSQAKKKNEAIKKEKKRIKNKAFIGRLNASVAEEENTFNVNAPQYLAKGGLVRSEKNPDKIDKDKDLQGIQDALKMDQEFLTQIFEEKYKPLMGINMMNVLGEHSTMTNFNRNKLEDYSNKLISKYQDLVITPEEIKAKMGEERYNKYIQNKAKYNDSPYAKGSMASTKGTKESTDLSKENFGWRNIIERYSWNKEKGDVTPYAYLQNKLPKDKSGKPVLNPTIDKNGNYIFNESVDSALKKFPKRNFAKGGFVLGDGTATSDSNQKKVEVGSQVIPSVKNSPKNLKNVVLNIAESTELDTELKEAKNGLTKAKVNLSKGELVIPPEKIAQAESVANAQGTTLDEVRNTINAMNAKGKPSKKSNVNLAKGTDKVRGDKYVGGDGNEYFYPLDEDKLNVLKPKLTKEKAVDPELASIKKYASANGSKPKPSYSKPSKRNFSIAPEATIGILQAAAGAIGRNRNESKINQSLAVQKAIAEQSALDAATAAEKSLSAKKASINTMFKDTQNTADKLKVNAINDLAGNSLTSQEFSSNYNKVAGTVLDAVSRANREKTSLLLDAESQGLSNIQNVNERGTALKLGVEGKKNAFNIAKATQSGLLQQAGMENLIGYMKNIKDEKVRKEKMQSIVDLARERNISIQDAATIMLGDLQQGVSGNIKLS